MRQAIKLDSISAEGDASAQKNLQVVTISYHILLLSPLQTTSTMVLIILLSFSLVPKEIIFPCL